MVSNDKVGTICILGIGIAMIIAILFFNGRKLGIGVIEDPDAENYTGNEYITDNDINDSWDRSDATHIELQGDNAKIKGDGAYMNKDRLVIAEAGKYLLSGDFHGTIHIDANERDKIWILLDGVNIISDDKPCIKVKKADKVFITLAEDSSNSLYQTKKGEAAINSAADCTINGKGRINIISETGSAIIVKDDLVIAGGSFDIEAGDDGIHGSNNIAIINADMKITAKDDAISAGKTVNYDKSKLLVPNCYEGIEAGYINIYGGDIDINSDDDGFNARMDETDKDPAFINIYDGNISIVNTTAKDADGLDSNGDIAIYGGNIFISLVDKATNNPIDFGSENAGKFYVYGGSVVACGSPFMAEKASDESTQASLLYVIGESIEAGKSLTVYDENNNLIIDKVIPSSYSLVFLTGSEFEAGKSYRIVTGSKETMVRLEGISTKLGDSNDYHAGGPRMDGDQMPEGGMRPDGGMRPEGGMRPDGEMRPEKGNRPEMRPAPEQEAELNEKAEAKEEMDSDVEAIKSLNDYDEDTWFILAVSLGLLFVAILYGIMYRRRR